MTVNNWLRESKKTLSNSGSNSAYLDTLLILEHVISSDRVHILAHTDQQLTQTQIEQLTRLLNRRKNREPIAYLTNKIEFYGRMFYVDSHVLIPRPESETFMELLSQFIGNSSTLLDLGCGSGILGITAKLEHPNLNVTLADIDNDALTVAKHNAELLHANVSFAEQDLLTQDNSFNIIVSNLPYVPTELQLEPELSFEPDVALFSGHDGLDHYRRLWNQLKNNPAKLVLTESLVSQHNQMIEYAKEAGYVLRATRLLIQVFVKS